jgi:hypothetical protein
MHNGQCSCGAIQFHLELPASLNQYHPRACDCDFCVANNIQYLSDPKGTLFLSPSALQNFQRQGSGQAAFITCQNCKNIVAAISHFDDKIKGAVNAQLLAQKAELAEPQTVSPKYLSAEEKRERWLTLWLNVVVG